MIRWNVSKSNEAIDREQGNSQTEEAHSLLQMGHNLHHRGARSGTPRSHCNRRSSHIA